MPRISDEEIRRKQREQWTLSAPGWHEAGGPSKPITDHIIALSRPMPGYQVLDLACGVGDPAFTLADRVGPTGFVLGLDITQAMVDRARSRAEQNHIRNVQFETLDNEMALGVPRESFDLCTCRHGLMFMPHPQSVMQSLSTAVKPGGRMTISTWGSPQNSPAFTLPGQIVRRHANLPTPDPQEPGLFSLSTPEIHKQLWAAIGFQTIEIHTFDCPVMAAESPQALWERVSTMGTMVSVIRELPSAGRERLKSDFLQTMSNRFSDNGIVLSAEAIASTGIKSIV